MRKSKSYLFLLGCFVLSMVGLFHMYINLFSYSKSTCNKDSFNKIPCIAENEGEGNRNHELKKQMPKEFNKAFRQAAKFDETQLSRSNAAVQMLSELKQELTDVNNNKADLRGRQHKKVILIYTSLFGELPWNWAPNGYNFYDKDGTRCKVHHCEVTYNKSRLKESDLVIFHGRDTPPAKTLEPLRSVNRNHLWGFLSHESPLHTWLKDLPSYRYLFNWTITYRVDSDVFIQYWGYKERNDKSKLQIDYSKGKKRLVFIALSHCFKERINFIKHLKKFVDVDVYGKCSKLFLKSPPECKRFTESCNRLQREYKFYLAFENSFCIDFITEKYWENGLHYGLVPIVVGGANYSDPNIAFPGSYVNALDFSSFKKLADYIHYLNKNNTAYNEYHQWRSKYRTMDRNPMCKICEKLNAYKGEQKTVDLQKFWGINETCKKFDSNTSPLFIT